MKHTTLITLITRASLIAMVAILIIHGSPLAAPAASLNDELSVAEQYVEAHPDDSEALLQLGISYMKFGRHSDAIKAIESSIDISSDDPFAFAWLARAYAETGSQDKARDLAEQAMDMAPDDRSLNEFAGGVMYELADYEKAAEIAESLVGDEFFYSTRDGSEILLLLLARLQLGDSAAVKGLVEKALIVEKSDSDCMRALLADALIGSGEKKWLALAMELINGKTGECEICGALDFRKGYVSYKSGDYEAAEKSFMDSATAQCDGEASYGGRKESEIQAILSARMSGSATNELLDWAKGLKGLDVSPTSYWTESLLLLDAGNESAAAKAFLKGSRILPVAFASSPGPYSLFTEDDYQKLYELGDIAGQDMETFSLTCGKELPVPVGAFFTSIEKPGLENIFRYSGRDETGMCGFDIFKNESVEIDDDFIEDHSVMPISFSEEVYFIKSVYPSERFIQTAWYAQLPELFPGLVPKE